MVSTTAAVRRARRREREIRRRIRRAILVALCVLAAALGCMTGLVLIDSVDLPEAAELEHYRPPTTTALYDTHGDPIGSFALERRVVVTYDSFAPILRDAVISIEDRNFKHHWGVNVFRVVGAAWHDLRSSGRAQGASTLTMQLARNLFLTDQRTAARKLQETLLSIQIEHTFTKPQIFTMYANQIYLGHGVYGFEAAAEYYFSKHAAELTLPEAALLAGLPKGPEEFSPTQYPERALKRRSQVLAALRRDRKITKADEKAAELAPLGLHIQAPPNTSAPWFVEDIRRRLEHRIGSIAVHRAGLRVYTTLDLSLQRAANLAVLEELAAYERRQGWRGHLVNLRAEKVDLATFQHPDWAVAHQPGDFVHVLVTHVEPKQVTARMGKQVVTLQPADWRWTRREKAQDFLRFGDVIYVRLAAQTSDGWRATLEEDTGAQAALLAIDNATGNVLALVGGRDFALSQYNRATEARRQVGSSFKPYVYAAAVERGVTPDTMILDAPTSFGSYRPRDYENNTLGAITIRKAFADSRNIPAVKLAAEVGMQKVIETARRFGITSPIPPYLPVALGAVDVSLAEQVSGYSVFPNEGLRVTPRLIRRVTDGDGVPLDLSGGSVRDSKQRLQQAGPAATSAQVAQTMLQLLRAVVAPGGTGAEAARLEHPVAGKTGTTSNFTDAWFVGFSPSVTCGVWVGYDNRTPLGAGETGAKAALPIWMDLMRVADARHPAETFNSN